MRNLVVLEQLAQQAIATLPSLTEYFLRVERSVTGAPINLLRVFGAIDLRRRSYLVNSAIVRQLVALLEPGDDDRKTAYLETLTLLGARERLIGGKSDPVEVFLRLRDASPRLPSILQERGRLGSSDIITRFGHLCTFDSFLQEEPRTATQILDALRNAKCFLGADRSMLKSILPGCVTEDLDDAEYSHWLLQSAAESGSADEVKTALAEMDSRRGAELVGILVAEEKAQGLGAMARLFEEAATLNP